MSFAAADPPRKRKIDLPLVGLVTILLAGAALRFYGLDWDGGYLFHPDERHILMVTMRIGLPWPMGPQQLLDPNSPLNPQSFAYGSFVFYLLKLVAYSLSLLGNQMHLAPDLSASSLDTLRIVGRILSASFDTGSIALTYFLGRRLYGPTVGLLAAAFVAFSVIHLQLAHFYASDTLLTFSILAALLMSMRLLKDCSLRTSLLVGFTVGLALVTKVSSLPIFFALATAYGLRLFAGSAEGDGARAGRLRFGMPGGREMAKTLTSALATVAAVGVVFVVAQPYAIIDASTFLGDIYQQNQMVRGLADFEYTRQYANREPYWYFLTNLVTWGLGLPLGLAAVAGTVLAVSRSFLKPRPAELVVLAWIVPYYLITGSFHAKFLRYLLPISPILSLFAAQLLLSIAGWAKASRSLPSSPATLRQPGPGAHRRFAASSVAGFLVGVVLIPTVFYAVAYANIYSDSHPAVRASEWIGQHVPKGTHIAMEHWEEVLPVLLADSETGAQAGGSGYVVNVLNMYDEDTPAKLDHLVEGLRDSEYIVFYSQRLYGTIPRLPERYPLSREYYRLLFSGELGYELEAFFTSYPNLLGVAFVDDTFGDARLPAPQPLVNFRPAPVCLDLGRADESFTVYDHPKVMIFKKRRNFSEGELREMLSGAPVQAMAGGFGGAVQPIAPRE